MEDSHADKHCRMLKRSQVLSFSLGNGMSNENDVRGKILSFRINERGDIDRLVSACCRVTHV